jgi:Kdo2-lipid IVA lauroyltransferase/acyltransferase
VSPWAPRRTEERWPAADSLTRPGSAALRLGAAVVAALPLPVAAWLGRRLGDLAYAALARRRRLALRNLTTAFPGLSPADRHRVARRSFQHLGLVFAEGCVVLRRPLDEVTRHIRVAGLHHLRAVMEEHGRALVLTAHLGNWELLTLAPVLTGYPLTVVVRPLDSSALDAWAERLRRTAGVEVVAKRAALRPVLAALRRGRLVGILLDQNAARHEGVFVPFFGREASTSRAMAVLALRTRTPVLPAFTRRIEPGRHEIVIHPPLALPPGTDGEAIRELTASCTRAIEDAVRATPEQWLWSHDRWRTRPPA